ncbi:hypothetical protein D3C87_1340640 [compost metagenome]
MGQVLGLLGQGAGGEVLGEQGGQPLGLPLVVGGLAAALLALGLAEGLLGAGSAEIGTNIFAPEGQQQIPPGHPVPGLDGDLLHHAAAGQTEPGPLARLDGTGPGVDQGHQHIPPPDLHQLDRRRLRPPPQCQGR